MLIKILSAIMVYGAPGIFVSFLARMSIRYEMNKHPDPPYRVVIPFIKTIYGITAAAYGQVRVIRTLPGLIAVSLRQEMVNLACFLQSEGRSSAQRLQNIFQIFNVRK